MPKALLFFLPLLLTLSSCSHYRGIGAYRRPSDYSFEDSGVRIDSSSQRRDYRPHGAFQLNWPVPSVRLTQNFKRWPRHEGIDLGGYLGMPILAAHEGVVIYAGKAFRGYGKMIILEYDQEWATLYSHMSEIYVSEGMILRPGDTVGSMGRTGRATGVHLHFEVLRHKQPINPLSKLNSNRWSNSRAQNNP